jgi:alpha/beta superfamily hydrolase
MGMYGENHHPAINGKYIMFCNPNGVYIQFFAVENTYIKEYLKQVTLYWLIQGYQIILWNYRGYGQSTGSPSITKSQTDAMKVYNYFTGRGLKIELVHGYSIGGCAAIGLVSKLEKRDKERSKPSHVANPKLLA